MQAKEEKTYLVVNLILLFVIIVILAIMYYLIMGNKNQIAQTYDENINVIQSTLQVEKINVERENTIQNVDEAIIPRIDETLSNTGKTLTNAKNNRYYYNQLESTAKEIYNAIESNLDNMKSIILKETDLPEQTFEVFEKIKNVNISSFDLDRKLTEIYSLINQIKLDYDKLDSNEDFSNYFEDVYEIDEKLEAAKSFYNKYTTLLNTAIKKFPSNVIASFHHIKVKAYFDGKDMFDEEIKDFKL